MIGHYQQVTIEGKKYRIYYEESGQGIPLLCLHTAGADSRQYMHLLENEQLTQNFRVIAFDLPYHGRSMPPDQWWLQSYRLTTDWYVATIKAFVEALKLERPVVMGCSMGGNITLELAYRYPERFRAMIALEAASETGGRLNDYLYHPEINGGEMCATNTYGLMAPQSPESYRREVWWMYSQGAPGVYYGDIYFYSEDWRATDRVSQIDTNQCPIYMLTGEYDYSCTPQMSEETAKLIPGAFYQTMREMGHFPMSENPELLLKYLQPILTTLSEKK